MPGVVLRTARANDIDMRYAEMGSGPLVLFCHGWPESWYSWRHQLTAVSAAGIRCVAPEPIDQYTLHHLVGHGRAGEGARRNARRDHRARLGCARRLARRVVAPDLFPAVCAMSVPYSPRAMSTS